MPRCYTRTPWVIGSRSIGNRYVPILIGGFLLLATYIDWHFFKPIAADNGYRMTASLIYGSANSILYLSIFNILVEQIGIDRPNHTLIPRATGYCRKLSEHIDQNEYLVGIDRCVSEHTTLK